MSKANVLTLWQHITVDIKWQYLLGIIFTGLYFTASVTLSIEVISISRQSMDTNKSICPVKKTTLE